jgi:ferredoxin
MDRKSFIRQSVGLFLFGSLSYMGFASLSEQRKQTCVILEKNCNGCGQCLKACKEKALKIEDKLAVIDPSKCKSCGDCLRFCKRKAISLIENKK